MSISESRSYTTGYYFYPNESFLGIDRSDYADDGFIRVCIEDHYRVEFLSARYIILYDLEDVEVEPDGYAFRLELERVV